MVSGAHRQNPTLLEEVNALASKRMKLVGGGERAVCSLARLFPLPRARVPRVVRFDRVPASSVAGEGGMLYARDLWGFRVVARIECETLCVFASS